MATPAPRKRGVLRVLWAVLRGARKHTPMRQLSSYGKPWSGYRFRLRFVLLCELLRELRSAGRRTAEMHGKSEDEQGRQLTWLRAFPVDRRDAAYQAHTRGIESLRIHYPWLTSFDFELFQEGFVAGSCFQSGNPCTEERKTGQSSTLTLGELYPKGVPKSCRPTLQTKRSTQQAASEASDHH
jgi:hypothetical protein